MRCKARIAPLILGAILALAIGGCRSADSGSSGSGSGDANLRRDVGQVLVMAFSGGTTPPYVRKVLRSGRAAGVILFEGNVPGSSPRKLTQQLQSAARGGALVVTDDEGGGIMNVPTPTALPAPPELTGDVAGLTTRVGQEMRQRGINVDLAPVADVAKPGSFMTSRSFPGGPAEVAQRARAAVRGFEIAHVGATVKHFPGLGRARRSTDDFPVTIGAPRAALMRDLAPFNAAIEAGVPLVMASHALYPALDDKRIASQSRPILDGLLRKQMGFRGVAITDSIEADAVISRSSVATAAARSIGAGADLVLMTGRGSWIRIYPALLKRARRDKAFRDRIHEAAGRVADLKDSLGLR